MNCPPRASRPRFSLQTKIVPVDIISNNPGLPRRVPNKRTQFK